jgi:regulator of cell morphogenesis and NO signaling
MNDAKENLTLTPTQTVREVVVNYPLLRQPLEELGIDYCCGGLRSMAEAVRAAGREWDETRTALIKDWNDAQKTETPVDWNAASTTALVDHILESHHVFTRAQLERIDGLLQKVQRAHGEKHGSLLASLRALFDDLRADISEHLMKEEQILFPVIKEIDAFVAGTGTRPAFHCGTIEHPIRQMLMEHDTAGEVLVQWRRLTDNYQPPADACQTFGALYDALQALEADLHEHIHLENNILFPRSLTQEQSMRA